MGPFLRVALLALLVVVSGSARAKDELTIGIRQFPTALHPLITASTAKSYVLGMAVRPITAFDKAWNIVCLVCAEVPAPTGQDRAVRLVLKDDLFWGDGVPVTSRDVVFAWTVGRHPDSGVGDAQIFRRIERIDVEDDRTMTLHFDSLPFDFADLSAFYLLPQHLEQTVFDASPADYQNRSRYVSDPTNAGLYFGPYVISEVTQGARISLTANPHWKEAAPAFRRIVVNAVENTAALTANLLSGTVDMIPGEIGLGVDQAIELEKNFPGRFAVTYQPALRLEHIDLNLDNPILQDVRVRRALFQAIDRTAIVASIFGGKHVVAESIVNPLDRVHASDLPSYPFNPAAAGRLLDEAGWRASGLEIRRNAAGEPLLMEINSTAGDRTRDQVLQALQNQWRAVGIDVRIKNYPARVLFGEMLFKRRYAAMGMYNNVTSPEWVPRTILHSAHIPSADNNWSGYNLTGYRSVEMDGILERLEGVVEPAERLVLWRRLQVLYAEDIPSLPLYFQSIADVLPKAMQGVAPTGTNSLSTLWVERWRLP